jgi:hypothetical protein
VWHVNIDKNNENSNNDVVALSLKSIDTGLEVWLGGIMIYKFVMDSLYLVFDGKDDDGDDDDDGHDYDDDVISKMRNVRIESDTNNAIYYISARIGPMLNSDYGQIVVILEEGINGINAHGLLDVFEPNTYTNTTSASLELTIDAICFSKSEIRGIISLLERMGVSTTAAAAAATVKRETTTMSTDVDEEDEEEEEEVNNHDGH